MQYKKIIFILIFPLLVEILSSCCRCPEVNHYEYSNCDITLQNLDNSGDNIIVAMSDSITEDNYGIRVAVNRSLDVCKTYDFPSIFINSATACSCPNDTWTARQEISSLKIYTINHFDTSHYAGSEVTEYFSAFSGDFSTDIDSFIKNYNYEAYGYENDERLFDLLLNTPPSIGNKHSFKIVVSLIDGKKIIKETSEVIIY